MKTRQDWITRGFMFFVPPLVIFFALAETLGNAAETKDAWRWAGYGVAFYVISLGLLVGCSMIH